ncbi:unnamed protein product [Lota lota]
MRARHVVSQKRSRTSLLGGIGADQYARVHLRQPIRLTAGHIPCWDHDSKARGPEHAAGNGASRGADLARLTAVRLTTAKQTAAEADTGGAYLAEAWVTRRGHSQGCLRRRGHSVACRGGLWRGQRSCG